MQETQTAEQVQALPLLVQCGQRIKTGGRGHNRRLARQGGGGVVSLPALFTLDASPHCSHPVQNVFCRSMGGELLDRSGSFSIVEGSH